MPHLSEDFLKNMQGCHIVAAAFVYAMRLP